jgi:DNA-binding transcriptional ArsR family regulator
MLRIGTGMVADLNPRVGFIPAEEFSVTDLETLKVLADPLRLKIRELMFEPTTVKQVAAELDMPATKLYYHINLLEKHELIVLVDTRIVSGIIEKHYQVSAFRVKVAKHLLSPDDTRQNTGLTLAAHSFFDGAREDLLQAVRDGVVEWNDDGERHRGLSLQTGTLRLTEAQAADFYREVEELFTRYTQLSEHQQTSPEARSYRTFYVLHPVAGKNRKGE